MYSFVKILGKEIPVYWLVGVAGLAVCFFFCKARAKKFEKVTWLDLTNMFGIGLVGMFLGGRLLYILTTLPLIIKNWSYVMEHKNILWEVISNGIVFYGGLFGFLLAIKIYIKKYKLDSESYFDLLAPAIPLFHAFGRVGCFFNGCCYGIESDACGIAFHHSAAAPNGVKLLPVQLIGSAGELLLFFLTLRYEKKHHEEGKAIYFYLALYAIGRFILEFFRGDEYRGVYFGLSTSAWISLAMGTVLLAHLMCQENRPHGSAFLAEEEER